MDKIIAFSNKTEARDQFTKSIQYISKFIAWSLTDINKIQQKRFTELFIMVRDARKFFRLFKSLHELKNINDKIKDLLWQKDKFPILLEIISRLGYLVKWIFDNLYILSAINLIKTDKINLFMKYSCQGWLFGLLWGILKNIYEIIKSIKRNNKKELLKNLIELVGKIGDLIPASNGSNLTEYLLGYKFHDGIIGIGGTVSAVSSIWGLWNVY